MRPGASSFLLAPRAPIFLLSRSRFRLPVERPFLLGQLAAALERTLRFHLSQYLPRNDEPELIALPHVPSLSPGLRANWLLPPIKVPMVQNQVSRRYPHLQSDWHLHRAVRRPEVRSGPRLRTMFLA